MPSQRKGSRSRLSPGYGRNVFINCPFDDQYKPIFESIVFTVLLCGFRPLSALQRLDSSEVRLHKIIELIRASRFSIHDLSRTETAGLPRFNMPLELGIDIGCKEFGPGHGNKRALVLERKKYLYQMYISDIAGQDSEEHQDKPEVAIAKVRNWLAAATSESLPGPAAINKRYDRFRKALPEVLSALDLKLNEMTFVDFCRFIEDWLREGD